MFHLERSAVVAVEKPQGVQVAFIVLGARGNGKLARRDFWGKSGEGGGPRRLYWLPRPRDRSVLVLPFVFGF